jgi:hypothetical protein
MKKSDNRLRDPWWRLNNLYWIVDKEGTKIKFKPNWAQRILYESMWYLNVILKARQLGCTTFIQLFMLDRCLFNNNVTAGIVAHNKEDAQAFFAKKIKFAYDNLPDDLKSTLKAESNTVRSLEFSNGSSIQVGTSLRSGTYQYVHVSEFGKMCAKFPEKASEVITGTLNTIAPGQMAFIESTAEGPFGEFYDMCKAAEDLTSAVDQKQVEFTQMDWKYFFFPWYKHPDYVLAEKVDIPQNMMTYFKELREDEGIDLTPDQKAWYVKKAKEQGDLMRQEYPATSAEAFERVTELSIFGKQLRIARREGRISNLPIARGVPVNTFWDIGRNDVTAIWFHQHIEARHHFIYYMEGRLEDLSYYVRQLWDLREMYHWYYGTHYLPHDVSVIDISEKTKRSRLEILQDAGLRPTTVVPKVRILNDGIEMTRAIFDQCWFDTEGCALGLKALHGYEWQYDEMHKTTRNTVSPGWPKNGSDAFRQFAQGYRSDSSKWSEQAAAAGQGGKSGRKYLRNRNRQSLPTNPDYDHVV